MEETKVVLEAREKLSKYYINESHYRYHSYMVGISYVIPMEDVDDRITKYILVLMKARKCVMGIKGDNYVLYQNSTEGILSFCKELTNCTTGIRESTRELWYDYFGLSKKFYITFSLGRYFNEEGISEILDIILKSNDSIVLSMIYPNNLTIMVMDKEKIGLK